MAGRDNPDGISSVGNGTVYNRMCTKWRHEKGSPDTKGFPDKKIEQVMGIEPTYLAVSYTHLDVYKRQQPG